MKIKIDGSGRIVIPKDVRERFHLTPGTILAVEELPQGLFLRSAGQGPSMVRRNGLLVHLGKAPKGFRWNRMIDEMRDERCRDILGKSLSRRIATDPQEPGRPARSVRESRPKRSGVREFPAS
jgi:AbrB family looped-hinge helix DNA binding protein